MAGDAEQRKGTGFPGLTGPNRSVCIMVSARKGVRLTYGVHKALGPAWQQHGGGNDAGRFGVMGWAGSAVETGRLGGNAHDSFSNI
jgi:hypothetical protein